jgi:VIT1/CCC1 family predicted Fe2+/Mn2+ transporter
MNNKYKRQLQTEVDTSYLYNAVADNITDKVISDMYRRMADIEKGHANKLMTKIKKEGLDIPMPGASFHARTQNWLARIFGYGFILSGLMNIEKKIAQATINEKIRKGEKIIGNEQNHVQILNNLISIQGGISGSNLARLEGRHKSVGGNALRAAVMGSNDGLVSNLSLIMGVAGATGGNKEIIVAGIAGLLAGATSMALGEWLSVQSSRELYLRQIKTETEEFENSEEEELMELTLIYQSKGMSQENASEMAKEVFRNKETAIGTLVQEELGIDVNELGGSAWVAAGTSFGLFAVGAIIPLVPFIFIKSFNAVIFSLLFSTVGLFIIGSGITLFTGKGILFSGFRMVIFGIAAAAFTFGIGKIIGISITG